MTTQSQLDAILHGAAFAEITDRAFLRITGSDATRWLNGMVTNNIAALATGEGNYNFLLNAQGRIQGDCTIYREPGEGPATYLLETRTSQLEPVQKTLDHFIIMDDVELAPTLRIDQNVVAEVGLLVVGKNAPELLLKAVSDRWENSLPAAPSPGKVTHASASGQNLLIFAPPKPIVPEYELWFSDDLEMSLTRDFLAKAGAAEVSAETLEAFRIYSGTPKYGIDIRDRDLPQETAQTHALHFAKGCYLGQEIVERIRSRGQVHRTFTRFTLTGSLPSELPAPLEANAKPAGEITSAAQIGDTIYALGYARREALDTHATLSYQAGTAFPVIPNP
jgi:folate-binding protein YgfZ